MDKSGVARSTFYAHYKTKDPEYQLFEETVAKDIAFGPKNLGLPPEEIDQRVRRAMEWVHLDLKKVLGKLQGTDVEKLLKEYRVI